MIKGVLSEEKIVEVLSDEAITDEIFWECFIKDQNPLLKFDSRSGSELIDSVSGETATILTPCYLRTGASRVSGDKTRDEEKVLDGNDYTIYFQFRQVLAVGAGTTEDVITFGGGYLSTRRGIEIKTYYNKLRIYVADGTTGNYDEIVDDCNSNLLNQGLFDCIITINYTTKELKCAVYDEDGNLVGSETNRDISGYIFNSDQNFEYHAVDSYKFVIDNLKKFTGIKTLAQCQNYSYVTNLQFHIPNVYSTFDISGNELDFGGVDSGDEKVYYQMNSFALDYGFNLYNINNTGYHYTIYKNADGQQLESERRSLIWEATGGGICKLRDAKIRFTNAFFDRSNSTIWNDDCRASDYYDAVNTKDFHIEELNQRTLMSWLNAGYRGRLYINMNPNSVNTGMGGDAILRDATDLIEILLFTEDKTGIINKALLDYTNDILAAILDENGAVTYDDDGYVKLGVLKTTKPMFTIRIDDGYANVFDDWRPFFAALNVHPTMDIHSQLAGTTVGVYEFMSWENMLILISEGWEIISSGQYWDDWNSFAVTLTQHEQELSLSKSDIEEQGIVCNHLVPDQHGQANRASRYFAKKYGFHTSHCGWEYGDVNGTNPQEIDKFNLCAMACDLFDLYNIDQVDNDTEIANIKAQLDDALANNSWAILYMHDYSTYLGLAMTEIINYAQGLGIENVTMDEALENTAYL